MRLIDADQFLVDESEAYMSAQKQIQDMELRFLNNLVHQKNTNVDYGCPNSCSRH